MPDSFDPRPLFDIGGRAVVVTGGGRGLGLAMVRGLAACGAYVAIVGRSADVLERAAAEVTAAGGRAVAITADITTEEGRSAVVNRSVDEFGSIDVLINSAGVAERSSVEEVKKETYDRVHLLNAEAPLFLCQRAFPHLKASGRGSVINVVSTGIWTGGAGSVLYRGSKSALHAITMVLAQEWAPDGVRVNAIAPGAFDAGMGARISGVRASQHLARTPLGRFGRPEEVVPPVLFLASDAASYVTGTTIRVDGGAVSI